MLENIISENISYKLGHFMSYTKYESMFILAQSSFFLSFNS